MTSWYKKQPKSDLNHQRIHFNVVNCSHSVLDTYCAHEFTPWEGIYLEIPIFVCFPLLKYIICSSIKKKIYNRKDSFCRCFRSVGSRLSSDIRKGSHHAGCAFINFLISKIRMLAYIMWSLTPFQLQNHTILEKAC